MAGASVQHQMDFMCVVQSIATEQYLTVNEETLTVLLQVELCYTDWSR